MTRYGAGKCQEIQPPCDSSSYSAFRLPSCRRDTLLRLCSFLEQNTHDLVMALLIIALGLLPAILANSLVPVTLYSDHSCTTPSTLTNTTTLPLDTCVVTTGLGSFELPSFPCTSGDVQQYIFTDVACGTLADMFAYSVSSNNCYESSKGALAAIMLSCNQDTPGTPTATTTVDVGVVATAAAGSASTTSTSGSSNSGNGSSSSGDTTSTPTTGWDSLSLGTRIGIIIGVVVVVIGLGTTGEVQRRRHTTISKVYPEPTQEQGYAYVRTPVTITRQPQPVYVYQERY